MIVWTIALALNFSWSPIFFGLKQPVAALAVIVGLLAMIILFIRLTWPQDVVSALLFVPYAAWTSFATVLNAVICSLNNPTRDVRYISRPEVELHVYQARTPPSTGLAERSGKIASSRGSHD